MERNAIRGGQGVSGDDCAIRQGIPSQLAADDIVGKRSERAGIVADLQAAYRDVGRVSDTGGENLLTATRFGGKQGLTTGLSPDNVQNGGSGPQVGGVWIVGDMNSDGILACADFRTVGIISVEQDSCAELRCLCDAVDLIDLLEYLILDGLDGPVIIGTGIAGSDGQFADPLKSENHLIQCGFRCVGHADSVLGVENGLVDAPDLDPQSFADGQSGGIIPGAVDSQAAGQTLDILLELCADRVEIAGCGYRADVVVDTCEAHWSYPP